MKQRVLAYGGMAAVAALLTVVTAVRAGSADYVERMNGWHTYDYQAGLDATPAVNVFHPAVLERGGVWVDDSLWSIDDPEVPPSVLALIRYDKWGTMGGEVSAVPSSGDDLRGRCVTFDLYADQLDLNGAEVTFWAFSSTVGQRWHVVAPVKVAAEEWVSNRIAVSAVEWRRSWAFDFDVIPYLDDVLRTANSYGIGFIGFDKEPSGALGMRNFGIGSCSPR